MKSKIIFLHIPKTGGTTLARIFKENYIFWPKGRVFVADPREKDKRLLEMDRHTREKIRLIHGHIEFGVHRHLDNECTYVTYLRDPVRRVVSFYNFLYVSPGHYLYESVQNGGLSFEDFIESGFTHELDNLMVRMIAGVEKGVPIGAITETHLNLALHNVDKWFSAVGLTEYFDESLLIIRKKTGWNFFPYYLPGKVSQTQQIRYADLSDETIELIKEKNRFDWKLFCIIKERIERQISEGGADFRAEVARFRKRNRIFQGVMKYLPVYK